MSDEEFDNLDDVLNNTGDNQPVDTILETVETEVIGNTTTTIEDTPLTQDEALELTEAIQSTVTAVYVMLWRAHQGKAYKALGYDTWEEYVRERFDFSVRKSYRLLDLAQTVKAIEEAAPEDTEVHLTSAQVQDIKRELPRVTARVRTETEGKTPEESTHIIGSIVDETRAEVKEQKNVTTPEPDDTNTPQENEDVVREETEEEEYARLEEEADKILETHNITPHTPPPHENPETPKDTSDTMYDDGETVATLSMADGEENTLENGFKKISLHNFYTFIAHLPNLPEPEIAVQIMPEERARETIIAVQSVKLWAEIFLSLLPEDLQEEDFVKLMTTPKE
jgi:hypothetical protein